MVSYVAMAIGQLPVSFLMGLHPYSHVKLCFTIYTLDFFKSCSLLCVLCVVYYVAMATCHFPVSFLM